MELKKNGLFINCKYCGEDLEDETDTAKLIGLCRPCQDYLYKIKHKKKKKVKYQLG